MENMDYGSSKASVLGGTISAPEAAENGGFIPADVIKNQVLPSIRRLLPSMEGL